MLACLSITRVLEPMRRDAEARRERGDSRMPIKVLPQNVLASYTNVTVQTRALVLGPDVEVGTRDGQDNAEGMVFISNPFFLLLFQITL